MNTNQEKAKEILGEEKYNLLVDNGFMPIEVENLKVLLNHQEKINKLEERLILLENPKQDIVN